MDGSSTPDRSPRTYLMFDGIDNCVEVGSSPLFSVATTGALTVSASPSSKRHQDSACCEIAAAPALRAFPSPLARPTAVRGALLGPSQCAPPLSIDPREFLRSAAVADLGSVEVALGIDRYAVRALELSGHAPSTALRGHHPGVAHERHDLVVGACDASAALRDQLMLSSTGLLR
jgi:hypothetical protein